jgi:hypothetical protein
MDSREQLFFVPTLLPLYDLQLLLYIHYFIIISVTEIKTIDITFSIQSASASSLDRTPIVIR